MIHTYKARPVVCGNEQDEKENDCFSPLVDYSVIKVLLSLEIQNGWIVRHFEFQNAFPNGQLGRTVNAELPGYVYKEEVQYSMLTKLQRSLYGLRHASNAWFGFVIKKL